MALIEFLDFVEHPENYKIDKWDIESFTELTKSISSYLKYTYELADTLSHDPVTRIGSMLLLPNMTKVTGTNQISPSLVNGTPIDEIRQLPIVERPQKYFYMEHAERNSIFDAQKESVDVSSCIMFCPMFACADCARVIANSGTKLIIGHEIGMKRMLSPKWRESIEAGNIILDSAGINRVYYPHLIGNCENICDGERWYP